MFYNANVTDALNYYINKIIRILPNGKVLILNALPGAYLNAFNKSRITCIQTFYPLVKALERYGFPANPELNEEEPEFDHVIYFGTKFKDKNLFTYARSLDLLVDRGTFIAVLENRSGAKSNKKYIESLYGNVQSFSKSSCRVIVSQKNDLFDRDLYNEWITKGEKQLVEKSELISYPGTFSSKSIDKGSKMLIDVLPEDLEGEGADLGAGYGFLSYSIFFRCPKVSVIHLYEAEYDALEAARYNMDQTFHRIKKRKEKEHVDRIKITYHWHDITMGLNHSNLDWVITNPPFHHGIKEDVDIGRAFIEAGYNALKPGGIFYMVANRHLPYEQKLKAFFPDIEKLIEENGFKVYAAKK